MCIHPFQKKVVERGGFVWLFFGDRRMPVDERPPIPTTPELEAREPDDIKRLLGTRPAAGGFGRLFV